MNVKVSLKKKDHNTPSFSKSPCRLIYFYFYERERVGGNREGERLCERERELGGIERERDCV